MSKAEDIAFESPSILFGQKTSAFSVAWIELSLVVVQQEMCIHEHLACYMPEV